ncbi:hypothetical protein R6242_21955 [Iodobacter sp. CM08]|uniref:hypothetical protein n=1 Tax=Iodobacter sp. CM08 TaxID=3085902 RepID=UPI0029827872|nr:hypothetical protein [Iodobacter sp. CM08]MDW5419241.1 hypothetical protein [Iodobacter sp. CM08]
MNGYTVCSFKINSKKKYLVLEVVADIKNNKALLQAFMDDGSCYPFPLSFTVQLPEAELLKEAFVDGINHLKMIEGWQTEGSSENLAELIKFPHLLHSIKANCKSEILASDIENKIGVRSCIST